MKKDYGRIISPGEIQSLLYVRRQIWTNPPVGTATAVLAATNSNLVVTAGITSPTFPRVLSVVSAGSGHNAAGTVTINGTNMRGVTISEAFTLNGNTTVTGLKAFKTVTSVDMTAVTGNDANNTVSVGTGAALGLDRLHASDGLISSNVDGVNEATRSTIVLSSTAIESNTISFNTALANTKVFRANFVCAEKTTDTNTTA